MCVHKCRALFSLSAVVCACGAYQNGIGIASDDIFMAIAKAFYASLEANLMILLRQLAEAQHIDSQLAEREVKRWKV